MLTVREASEALGMSRENIVARIKRGTIRAKQIPAPNAAGFYNLIPEAEIERIKKEKGR